MIEREKRTDGDGFVCRFRRDGERLETLQEKNTQQDVSMLVLCVCVCVCVCGVCVCVCVCECVCVFLFNF